MNQNTDLRSRDRADGAHRGKEAGGRLRKRGLFLAVDILLIAAIVVSVLLTVSLLTPFSLFGASKGESRTVSYTLELAGISSAAVGALHEGDTVVDFETGACIGRITAIEKREYTAYGEAYVFDSALETNVITNIKYPETFCTVVLTVVADATYTQGVGYSVEQSRIAVGRAYTLVLPAYTGQGQCVSFVK